jgi:predicted nucleotidyltransferase
MKWPDADEIDRNIRTWAKKISEVHHEILRIGYFGSYARNEWGVGSDCDIVVIVKDTCEVFEKRARFYDVETLPVPADVLVYTKKEWEKIKQEGFGKRICSETIWVFIRE